MAITRIGPNQSINLASNITGTLPVANGGTAITSGFINGTATPGKILQIINGSTSMLQSTTSASYSDVEVSSGVTWETAITPSATSSTILVIGSICIYNAQNSSNTQQENRYNLHCDAKIGSGSYSAFLDQNWMGKYYYNGTTKNTLDPAYRSFTKIHSPSTTSAVTYKFQYACTSANGMKAELGGDNKISSLTLMEIAG
jgi:hypothetical protein